MNNLYKISIKYICLQLKLLFPFEWHVNHVVDLKYNLQIESGFVDQQCWTAICNSCVCKHVTMTIGECALGTIQAFSFSMDKAKGKWPEWMPHLSNTNK